ncbi:MAG: hypothetical protein CL897_05440 [Dehalococcoidia bacterium]|nr:hypothetical protein [Dehalococcoidia bacterium]HCV00520.1 hypothetical protein [Dehalococcoidia bacterium]|tara:strand:+ start:5950 stop:6783 length:834 start_codon:yes stop_codon:yes gene_type:complete
MSYARPELLAEPQWLEEHTDDSQVRIIDCATLEAYRRAHIPGAVHLPVHYYIKEQGDREGGAGMFVMPPDEFATLMSSLGVDADTTVVTYDDNNSLVAARLWWVLNYYGHSKVKVLNGGWHRWLTEEHPVTFHATRPEERTFTSNTVSTLHASAEDLLAVHDSPTCTVLDVRSDGEWEGSNWRGNKRGGHVPGAHHLEWTSLIERKDTRRFLPSENMKSLLEKAGVLPEAQTITYCQGGIRAAHTAFVLTLLGFEDVRVYDGSMYEWANREDTPLIT